MVCSVRYAVCGVRCAVYGMVLRVLIQVLLSFSLFSVSTRYCLCRGYNDGQFMIGCDGCSEWYHGRCIGLTEELGKTVSSLECPVCAKKANQEYKYDFLPSFTYLLTYFLTYLTYFNILA